MAEIKELIKAQPASDGDGVKLLRVFGGRGPERFDPFLMLDEFGSESASDYIGGFPPHPHRGFETVTYMLQGKMEHRDHMNNVGLLQDGDVQWMTAGSGVIHSEMPQQTEGKMRGFQLWLNLPADKKMVKASYEDVAHSQLPRFSGEGVEVVGIAGQASVNGEPFTGHFQKEVTSPLFWDLHLEAGQEVSVGLDRVQNVLVYAYEGKTSLDGGALEPQTLARLGEIDKVTFHNGGSIQSRFILLAGTPLREPVVQYGPFVMNTSEQIEQALQDYKNNQLV